MGWVVWGERCVGDGREGEVGVGMGVWEEVVVVGEWVSGVGVSVGVGEGGGGGVG